jgi:hypothetical protein
MRSGRRQVSTLRWTWSTSVQLIRTRSDVSAVAIPSRARWCRVLPVGRNELRSRRGRGQRGESVGRWAYGRW